MRPQIMNRCHVQIGGRFVQQIDLRIHRIDGSKGNFLLLPAGESKDIAAQQVFDTECLGCFHHTLSHLFLRHSLVFHAECDFTVGVHIEELCPRVLKYAADLFRDAVHRKIKQILTVQQYLARQLSCEKLRDQAVDEPR